MRRFLMTNGTEGGNPKESGRERTKARVTIMDSKVHPITRQRSRNMVVVEEDAVVVDGAELAVAVAAPATPPLRNDLNNFGVAARLEGRVGDGAAAASKACSYCGLA
jgi:hypothetical protein